MSTIRTMGTYKLYLRSLDFDDCYWEYLLTEADMYGIC